MRKGKLTIATLVASVALGAVPAAAGVQTGDDENEYEGRVEKNSNTYFGLDRSGDRVEGFTARILYDCEQGPLRLLVQSKGDLRVEDKRFAGKLPIDGGPNNSATGNYRLRGRFGADGKVEGTIDAEVFFGTERCYSGRLDWTARKGVDLDA